MRAWGAAVSAGHLALGALGWLLIGLSPVFFACCAAITLAVALLAAPLLRPRGHHDGRGEDDDGGGGPGGGDGRDPDGEPPWWPQFERDLRAYEAEQGRAQDLTKG